MPQTTIQQCIANNLLRGYNKLQKGQRRTHKKAQATYSQLSQQLWADHVGQALLLLSHAGSASTLSTSLLDLSRSSKQDSTSSSSSSNKDGGHGGVYADLMSLLDIDPGE
jgi:hypothetical protein